MGGAVTEAEKACLSAVANVENLLNCIGMVATGIHTAVPSRAVLYLNCHTFAVSAVLLGQLIDL